MAFATDCSSGTSAQRLARIQRETRVAKLAHFDFPMPEVCPAWGVPELPPSERTPVRSKIPVLFISGTLFRRVNKNGKSWGEGLTEKAVWHVVREYARKAGIKKLAPHDLRRTCARLCHAAGGELEQIQFLLGHVSIQTTERYLGCKQRIRSAVNDRLGIEPES
jgi:integrase